MTEFQYDMRSLIHEKTIGSLQRGIRRKDIPRKLSHSDRAAATTALNMVRACA
ncbi:MAG: hypothetical protein ACREUR_08880 [Nitrosospira sp.]